MFGFKLVRKLLSVAPDNLKVEVFKELLKENGIMVDGLPDSEVLKMYNRFCNLATGVKGDGPLASKFNKWLLGEALKDGDHDG